MNMNKYQTLSHSGIDGISSETTNIMNSKVDGIGVKSGII
jgi:hypothetical protein